MWHKHQEHILAGPLPPLHGELPGDLCLACLRVSPGCTWQCVLTGTSPSTEVVSQQLPHEQGLQGSQELGRAHLDPLRPRGKRERLGDKKKCITSVPGE